MIDVQAELEQPVTNIRGIGEETAKILAELNIFTIRDLLFYFPFRFEDFRLRDLNEAQHGEKVTVQGVVVSEPCFSYYGRKKSRLTVRVQVDRYVVLAVFFNRSYLKNKLAFNTKITISGKWNRYRQQIVVNDVRFSGQEVSGEFAPVYSVKEGITVKQLRRWIRLAFEQYGHLIPESLPQEIRTSYKLYSLKNAIRAIHFPRNALDIKQARRRLVYEEFLQFQLKMQALRKFSRENASGVAIRYDTERLRVFIENLPFPLTKAQKRVLKEILNDLKSPYRMNRLLQGDVGSGKTVVAAISLYAAVTAGFQGAFMVPTEILAEQHH